MGFFCSSSLLDIIIKNAFQKKKAKTKNRKAEANAHCYLCISQGGHSHGPWRAVSLLMSAERKILEKPNLHQTRKKDLLDTYENGSQKEISCVKNHYN